MVLFCFSVPLKAEDGTAGQGNVVLPMLDDGDAASSDGRLLVASSDVESSGAVSEVGSDGQLLRKKLFVLERTLARRAPEKEKSLSEIVLNGLSPKKLPDRINPSGDDKEGAGISGAGGRMEPGSVSLSLGGGRLTGFSVSETGLDLTGGGCGKNGAGAGKNGMGTRGVDKDVPVVKGSGTSANGKESESANGNANKNGDSDCSSLLGDSFGLKVMLKKDSVDMDSLEKDGSMNGSFSSKTSDAFLGMENYERFKDLFADEKETDDYAVMGFGFEYDMGGMKLGVADFSRPPQIKKISFFGNETEGPYKIKATNVAPGSDEVHVGGAKLERGAGYEISYTKGEITFTRSLGTGERVVVEYEVAGGSGKPGKFTGFRLSGGEVDGGSGKPVEVKKAAAKTAALKSASAAELPSDNPGDEAAVTSTDISDDNEKSDKEYIMKFGPVSLENWGVTWLTDESIGYRNDGTEIRRNITEQSLMGFDGALSIGGGTKVTFEAASSDGNKSRDVGRHAEAVFYASDTAATDGNPMGPFNLDEAKLPIMEGSDELRLNGVLLQRDKDYTLDLEYGVLRLKNNELNVSALDEISLTYRYISDSDVLNAGGDAQSGIAGLVGVENEWHGIKHKWTVDRRSADFMLVGGRPGNQLRKEDRELSWSGGGISLGAAWSSGDTLQDRASWLVNKDETSKYNAAYEKGALKLSYGTDESGRSDNLAVSKTDSTKRNRNIGGSYKISDKYNFSFGRKMSDGNDKRSGNTSKTKSNSMIYKLDGEIVKSLKFNVGLGTGKDDNESGTNKRTSTKNDRSLSLKYSPGKRLSVSYDINKNEFSNSTVLVATEAATVASGTTDVPTTGSQDEKWRLQYKPTDRTTFMLTAAMKNQGQINGVTRSENWSYDLRRKLSDSADVQLRYATTDSSRPGQTQGTATTGLALKKKFSWFGGSDVSVKHDVQSTSVERTGATVSTSGSNSTTDKLTFGATPFWKDRKFSFEYSIKSTSRNGDNVAEDDDGDSQNGMKVGVEIPFIKESFWGLDWNRQDKSGRRSTSQGGMKLSLNGEPMAGAKLQLAWKSEYFRDPINPGQNRQTSDLNLVFEMTREW